MDLIDWSAGGKSVTLNSVFTNALAATIFKGIPLEDLVTSISSPLQHSLTLTTALIRRYAPNEGALLDAMNGPQWAERVMRSLLAPADSHAASVRSGLVWRAFGLRVCCASASDTCKCRAHALDGFVAALLTAVDAPAPKIAHDALAAALNTVDRGTQRFVAVLYGVPCAVLDAIGATQWSTAAAAALLGSPEFALEVLAVLGGHAAGDADVQLCQARFYAWEAFSSRCHGPSPVEVALKAALSKPHLARLAIAFRSAAAPAISALEAATTRGTVMSGVVDSVLGIVTDLKDPSCKHCGAKGSLLLCSGCRSTQYCGVTCQRADWAAHKVGCKNMAYIRSCKDAGK
jgi:hypothetical protein